MMNQNSPRPPTHYTIELVFRANLVSSLLFQRAQAVLRKAVGAFFVKADLYQGIGIVLGNVRIGYNPMHSDVLIHILLPALVVRLSKNDYFLPSTKAHFAALLMVSVYVSIALYLLCLLSFRSRRRNLGMALGR